MEITEEASFNEKLVTVYLPDNQVFASFVCVYILKMICVYLSRF